MGDLREPTRKRVQSRRFEEEVYEAVATELESGVRKEGLWLRALAHADGNAERAMGLYIRYRAQAMLDEAYTRASQPPPARPKTTVHRRVKHPSFFVGAATGRLDLVQQAIAAGIPVNAQNLNGCTALYLAATNGHVGIVQALLDAGGDPMTPNDAGRLPKHEALARGHVEISALLESD